MDGLVDQIAGLTLLEAADLVQALKVRARVRCCESALRRRPSLPSSISRLAAMARDIAPLSAGRNLGACLRALAWLEGALAVAREKLAGVAAITETSCWDIEDAAQRV